jgi:alpha-beta hydrolase superfamily lysophospholipase
MSVQKVQIKSSDGDTPLSIRIGSPRKKIVGYLQVVPDRYDYAERYDQLLEYLSDYGYLAFAADMIGHGESRRSGQKPGTFLCDNAQTVIVNDLNLAFQEVIALYPPKVESENGTIKGQGVRLVRPTLRGLIGVGIGCSIIRNYIKKFQDANALIFVGDEGYGNEIHKVIPLIKKMIEDPQDGDEVTLRKKIQKNYYDHLPDIKIYRNSYRLSKLSAIRKLNNDPLVSFEYSPKDEMVLQTLKGQMSEEQWLNWCPKYLPLMLISGYEDPVTNYTRSYDAMLNKLRYSKVQNVFFHYTEGARHDVLLDQRKEESWKSILQFANSINDQYLKIYEKQKMQLKLGGNKNACTNA